MVDLVFITFFLFEMNPNDTLIADLSKAKETFGCFDSSTMVSPMPPLQIRNNWHLAEFRSTELGLFKLTCAREHGNWRQRPPRGAPQLKATNSIGIIRSEHHEGREMFIEDNHNQTPSQRHVLYSEQPIFAFQIYWPKDKWAFLHLHH